MEARKSPSARLSGGVRIVGTWVHRSEQFTNPAEGEPEHGVDRLPALDADFGHELLQDRFALGDRGIPHPVGDHGRDLGQLSGCRLRDVLVLDGCAQLGLSAPERPELVVQGGNSRATSTAQFMTWTAHWPAHKASAAPASWTLRTRP